MSDVSREWSSSQLRFLSDVAELHISTPSAGAEPRTWLPIWVVVDGNRVFVRTWHRRSTGWYGRAVASGEAWVRIARNSIRVGVTAVGPWDVDAVDTAFRTKYGVAASSMVTAESAASTLLLTPA